MNDYLTKAIQITLRKAAKRESAERDQLNTENELKRDAMLQKAAKLSRNKINGKSTFADDNAFENICKHYGFNPTEVLQKSYNDMQDEMGSFGINNILGGLK